MPPPRTPTPPDQPPKAAAQQSRTGWMFVSGAALMLIGLAVWMHRLQESRPAPAGPDAGPVKVKPLIPDGGITPGTAQPLAFGQEQCVPWHVSAAAPAPAAGTRFLILTSRVVDPYGYILGGFGEVCGDENPILIAEDTTPEALAKQVDEQRPAAILAVGLPSVELARRAVPDTPLLFGKVPDPSRHGLDDGRAVGVVSWVPTDALVRHLLRVLPRKKTRWGILAPAGRMTRLAEQAERAARAADRQVTRHTILDRAGLVGILDAAAADSDAWLVFPDGKLVDDPTFRRIQIAAEQAKIPLCVPDEEHVRSGAYAGAGSDSHRIGEQLCHLAGALTRGELPAGKRIFCPEYSFAVLHNATIEKLGYILDPEQMVQAKLYKWH